MFLIKYNSQGNLVWAKSFGNTGDEVPSDMEIDSNGFLYVLGYFESPTLNFDTITLVNSSMNRAKEIFVTKFDSNGNVIWARSFGSHSEEWPHSITLDNINNIYITGYYSGTVVFDSISIPYVPGGGDIFLTKLDNSGNVIWAKGFGGNSFDIGIALATDHTNGVYITGTFRSDTLNFGSTSLYNSGTSGGTDIFIAKIDAAGNPIWAKSCVSVDWESIEDACSDADGNFIISGTYQSPTIIIDSDTLFNNSAGFRDIFILKIDVSGNILWSNSTGGTDNDYGFGIYSDQNDNIYLTGNFASPIAQFDTISLPYNGGFFIAKYDLNGHILWAISPGDSSGYGQVRAISVNSNDDIFITGSYAGTLNLGQVSTPIGNGNFFSAKLNMITGINEINNDKVINCFPNPWSTFTTIRSDMDFLNEDFSLMNLLGQEIIKVNGYTGESFYLHRDNLESGIYFLKIIERGGRTSTIKMIIQ